MPAYVISHVHIPTDPTAREALAAYKPLAAAAVAEHGGRYLGRDARPETLEGAAPAPHLRIVIIEFPDTATAHRWYTSPAYAKALQALHTPLDRQLIIADGLPPGTTS